MCQSPAVQQRTAPWRHARCSSPGNLYIIYLLFCAVISTSGPCSSWPSRCGNPCVPTLVAQREKKKCQSRASRSARSSASFLHSQIKADLSAAYGFMGIKRIAKEAKWKATGSEQAWATVSYIVITPQTIKQWKTEEGREGEKYLLCINTLKLP